MTATAPATPRRRKPARRVLELITTVPWAITAEALQTIIAVASREGLDPETIATKVYGRLPEPEAVAAKAGALLDGTVAATIRDGVATVPIIGPLFRYADFFTQISGGTTYDALATDVTAALESPEVGAILLDIDSPGGEANGVGELAQLIYDGRPRKPIIAYIGGIGASAAYWLAAATSEVVINETAIVGSIGTRMELLETWMRDAAKGVRTISIVSAQSPRKALTAPDMQALIDQLTERFVAAVAQYRGVTPETVLADFGQGGLFVGQAAIDAGLADRLGTYESVHAELAQQIGGGIAPLVSSSPFTRRATIRAAATETSTMGTQMKPAAAAGASAAPAAPEGQDLQPETLTAAQVAERYPEAARALRAEGASAERTRIVAIEELAPAGYEELIAAAKRDPAATPESTAVKLLQAQKAEATRRPATAADEAGRQHLANLAGDEAKSNAPTARAAGEGSNAVEVAANAVLQFATRRPQSSTPDRRTA